MGPAIEKVFFPIKFKIVFFTSFILISAFATYLIFALNVFKEDKSAYIFENGLSHVKNTTGKIDETIQSSIKTITVLSNAYNRERPDRDLIRKIFELDKNLAYFSIYSGSEEKKLLIGMTNRNILNLFEIDSEELDSVDFPFDSVKADRPFIKFLNLKDNSVPLVLIGGKDELRNHYYFSLLMMDPIANILNSNRTYTNYLIDSQGLNIQSGEPAANYIQQIIKSKKIEGVEKVEVGEKNQILVIYHYLKDYGLYQFSEISEKKAFSAANFLINKSILFVIIVLCLSIIISILVSKTLTRPLDKLIHGIKKVSSGEYNLELPVSTRDEIGLVSTSFNGMCKKIIDSMGELKGAYEQMTQMDKLATLGEISAGISHEINNPLSIAKGNVSFTKSMIEKSDLDTGNREEAIHYLQKVDKSLSRIRDIVVNMKKFVHKSDHEREYCNLADAINESVETIIYLFKKSNVKVTKEISSSDIKAFVNPISLDQVLVNLLKNSNEAIIDANIKGGEIIISLGASDDGKWAVIKIKDNGPGIPEDIQDKIFESFYTTKEVGKGTGLGLSLAKKIIEEMNFGILELNSQFGAGTEFTIKLPTAQTKTVPLDEVQITTFNQSQEYKFVLVASDINLVENFGEFTEKFEGISLVLNSSEEILNTLPKLNLDLIIVENEIEDDGVELSRKIRDLDYKKHIILLTDIENIKAFKQAKESGVVNDFLLKPLNKDRLITKLDELKNE
ncbi:MAG: hybrid sensor histidine kinase/response regulator [Bacteriovoracaceae bacterium]|nr:hybrid sensor histidine kinase/response regulator [Bacteriovoracaceae bacterium]